MQYSTVHGQRNTIKNAKYAHTHFSSHSLSHMNDTHVYKITNKNIANTYTCTHEHLPPNIIFLHILDFLFFQPHSFLPLSVPSIFWTILHFSLFFFCRFLLVCFFNSKKKKCHIMFVRTWKIVRYRITLCTLKYNGNVRRNNSEQFVFFD
jgi:hypothetical protein